MRPLELELVAFRSYEHAVVDWRPHDLVVIAGDTGAGKTSLLDAIAFALFGKTPEHGRPRDLLTLGHTHGEVRLTFALRDQVWRATRRYGKDAPDPAQLLERLERDGGETTETHADRVDERLRELVGMSFEAFTSAVLLAQGRFAQFLGAAPRDRDGILRELFSVASMDGARRAAPAEHAGGRGSGGGAGGRGAAGPRPGLSAARAARAAAAATAGLRALRPVAERAAALREAAEGASATAEAARRTAATLPAEADRDALRRRLAAARCGRRRRGGGARRRRPRRDTAAAGRECCGCGTAAEPPTWPRWARWPPASARWAELPARQRAAEAAGAELDERRAAWRPSSPRAPRPPPNGSPRRRASSACGRAAAACASAEARADGGGGGGHGAGCGDRRARRRRGRPPGTPRRRSRRRCGATPPWRCAPGSGPADPCPGVRRRRGRPSARGGR
ncbi:MAG: SMC family ATPase [Thermoleophilia bacterium]